MLNWIPAALSPVEYSFTGIVTRPKETIPEAKGRALIRRNITSKPCAGAYLTGIEHEVLQAASPAFD
jgi:hypothetical protein